MNISSKQSYSSQSSIHKSLTACVRVRKNYEKVKEEVEEEVDV